MKKQLTQFAARSRVLLQRMVRLRFGVRFHRAEKVQYIGPFLYDLRVHAGICLRWVTVGWWRDADECDLGDYRNMPFSA